MTWPVESATPSEPAGSAAERAHSARRGRLRLRSAEEWVAGAALAAMVVLLFAEIAFRPWFGYAIPSAQVLARQLTMWVALLGGALAARDGRLLALATGAFLSDNTRRWADLLTATVSAGIAAILCVAGVTLVLEERTIGTRLVAGVNAWVSQLILPIGFGLIALRLVYRSAPAWNLRAIAAGGVVAGLVIALRPGFIEGSPPLLWIVLLVGAGALGGPLVAVLGGLAVFVFMSGGIPPPTVIGSAYELTTHPALPAVPLFTLAGFLLAEGDTPARLLRMFRALFGWMPGGHRDRRVVVSAFFTIFTGGSGVTILALGGLLLPTLLRDGYPERFSLGMLTASGSLGLLLPPALPLILYAIVAEISVSEMLAGGILPGLLLMALAAALGVHQGIAAGVERTRFEAREAAAALWHGKWEVLLPVIVLLAFFGGYATLVETSAVTVICAGTAQVVIHRNIRLGGLRRVMSDCVTTIGGVLIILAVARGFSA